MEQMRTNCDQPHTSSLTGRDNLADNGIKKATSQSSLQNQSSTSVPAISLPKGGGAVRGMGEKFSANLVTGTGSLTVPIFTSSGRVGFGPQLSLSYDSGAGNGPFGFGWSLSLPSIIRKTDKGLPKYDDANDSDVFILSGSEDLVPIFKKDQNGDWMRDNEGKFILDEYYHNGYLVRRYRPRIEGLFARIERWTHQEKGDVHWRSISKDNIHTMYGKNKNSRIVDPADESRIFSWLICESYDDKGNAILYHYKEENSQGIKISLINEKNRTSSGRAINRYLKQIKYGNKTPRKPGENLSSRTDWLFEVVFDYGEHYSEDNLVQPTITVFFDDNSREWPIRKDPFSNYRSCFEVRTYRLCQRILMFHHFPDELDTSNYLVRSTDFTYDEQSIASFITKITQSGYLRKADGSYNKKFFPPLELEYNPMNVHEEIQEVDEKSLENLPIGLDGKNYQWIDMDGEGLSGILTVQPGSWFYKRNLSTIPFTKNNGEQSTKAHFGPLERISLIPSLAEMRSEKQQFLDLAGDGQLDLVYFENSYPGFFERNQDETWGPFVPFSSIPNISWNDPNLKFVDLTGDGHADVLITEDQVFTWYQSLGEEGFAKAEKVSQALDEENGPRLVFTDPEMSIYLADMSGDGLTDLVRIRNGEICYWPNLGYGRFGVKVIMDNSPWFDHSDIFDHTRIRLGDIDGSGVTDIIYVGSDSINFYFNQSGNSWSSQQRLKSFPHLDNIASVMVVDLLGSGTACLVWSSPLSNNSRNPMRYIDLMGGQKPHLLISVSNNMGAKTEIKYVPSTKFYLQDRLEGNLWITRLPFPVLVVEKIKTFDIISKNLFVTRYSYHHGYFDGKEREFRGFGMVEQWDTEEYATLKSIDSLMPPTNIEESSHISPVLTKTWFHTGIYFGHDHVSNFFAGLVDVNHKGEYYREPTWRNNYDVIPYLLDDTVLPIGMTAEEEREACRALKGSMLRQEIYAIDGTNKEQHPYTVKEQNFAIRVLQPSTNNHHAIFFTHLSEVISYHYERNYDPTDPRVLHELTLEVDNFGNILKQVIAGYGRRQSDSSLSIEADRDKQTKPLVTYTENNVTNTVDNIDNYRTPLSCESRTFELTGYIPSGLTGRYRHSDLVQEDPNNHHKIMHIFDNEIEYEDLANHGRERRLIEHERILYRKNDLTGLLDLGQLNFLALQGERYKLAFTRGLLTKIYQRPRIGQSSENLIPNPNPILEGRGGYVSSHNLKALGLFPDTDKDDQWWVPSDRVFYSQNTTDNAVQEMNFAKQHFFLPQRYQDPFGYSSIVTFDAYDLLMVETSDPLNNTIGAKNDYRVLQSYMTSDPNRNCTEVKFDILGMVVGKAVMGKPRGATVEGDSLDGFEANLSETSILDHISSPLTTDPHSILTKATIRLIYDLFAFYRTKDQPNPQPAVVYTLVRETHNSDLKAGTKTKIQHSFSYSDGFGREIEKKIQAEPGRLDLDDSSLSIVNPRWVGSGWTIFNNKGKPVRQYEPFFSATHNFESGNIVGVSPILFYDPLGRIINTLHPNHTYEKILFNPWQQTIWDVNDTTKAPKSSGDTHFDPKSDPDVGHYFSHLQDDEYLPTWYEIRMDTAKALKAWPDTDAQGHPIPDNVKRRSSEKKAAYKAAVHFNTPTIIYFDTLGRPFLTIAHNKVSCKDHDLDGTEEKLHTRVEIDIEGNQHMVRDPIEQNGDKMGRIVMLYDYDMLGNRIHQTSMESGERWMLNDVTGKPILIWDSRGHIFSTEYDPLRRLTRSFIASTDFVPPEQELLIERLVYGEQHPEDELRNLRGKLYLHFDQAGIMINDVHDFKGNLVRSSRRLTKEYKQTVDWNGIDANQLALPNNATTKLDLTVLKTALIPIVELETFSCRRSYDALNRTIQIIQPHSNQLGNKHNIVQPIYNEANMLEKMLVWLNQLTEPTGLLEADITPPSPVGVNNIDYDAKGRRIRVDYDNGVKTFYKYDLLSVRLLYLITLRNAVNFPNDCPTISPDGWPGCQVQNLHYTYDPVGNINNIRDDSQQTIYFRNKRVEPSTEYTYDAIYRLIEATGREHLGQVGGATIPHSHNDILRVRQLHPNDGNAMGLYVEKYIYDAAGNFLSMQHRSSDPTRPAWTRKYAYNEASLIEPSKLCNRLSHTSVGSNHNNPITETYLYDIHGSMIRMPHLASHLDPQVANMHWNYEDQLQQTNLGGGGTVYYIYDATRQRVRKVWEKAPGIVEEQIYLSGLEIFRRRTGTTALTQEHETFHIMDDQQRIALVETRTLDTDNNNLAPKQVIRFQFGNHLGSASLEMDDQARIISYEEFTSYGSTSYQAVHSQTETAKRYRYTGKERDEESGLYYHGARYYAPWLAKWVSCDPSGIIDGTNLYRYVNDNPVQFVDPTGRQQVVNDLDPTNPKNFSDFASYRAANPSQPETSVWQVWNESHSPLTQSSRAGQAPRESKGRVIEPPPPVSSPDTTLLVPQGFAYTQYQVANKEFQNPDNPLWARGAFFTLGVLAGPFALAEEYIMRPITNIPYTIHNAGIGIGEHAGRAYLWAQQGESGEATLEALHVVKDASTGFVAAASVAAPVAGALESRAVSGAAPVVAATETRAAAATGTVWDSIVATQPTYSGTVIPRSFTLATEGGSFWVHGNATEHLAERALGNLARGLTPEAVNISTQSQLTSLQSAASAAAQQGIQYGQMMNVGGWELIFAPPRQAGQLPTIIHALYR